MEFLTTVLRVGRAGQKKPSAHSRKGEVQSRVAVLERGAHRSTRQESMENTRGGSMRQLGPRGQVEMKVKSGYDSLWNHTIPKYIAQSLKV